MVRSHILDGALKMPAILVEGGFALTVRSVGVCVGVAEFAVGTDLGTMVKMP